MFDHYFQYRDRQAAGTVLAAELLQLKWDKSQTLLLSLPRGGTLVGAELAKILKVDHDLLITRKIGAPGNPELAIGALTPDGVMLQNERLIRAWGIPESYLAEQRRLELAELARRETQLRGSRPRPELKGKAIILVDDGIATGFTMEAALVFVRGQAAARVVVAVPVGPPETIQRLGRLADRVVCPLQPDDLGAVGNFYQDFHQVSDAEVRQALGG